MKRLLTAALWAALCVQAADVFGEPPAQMAGVQLDEAWPDVGFVQPVLVTHAGDGTGMLYVVERPGRIQRIPRWDRRGPVPQPEVFLDIHDRVEGVELQGGIAGLAFHPRFAENGLFYVSYLAKGDRPTHPFSLVISELRSEDGRGLPASERRLLEVRQKTASHNGGCIGFGPRDGMLYIAVGDDTEEPGLGASHSSQDPRSPIGKVLRIDVDTRTGAKRYGIPPDNPWMMEAGRVLPEIWAYGFRNPWRFSWDRKGRMWTVEPGTSHKFAAKLNATSREWVTEIVRAGNHGWPYFEGNQRIETPPPKVVFVPKTFEYLREGMEMTAGIGGHVYRGKRVVGLYGKYVFGDFGRGEVYAIDLVQEGAATWGRNMRLVGEVPSLGSLGEDQEGELYFCTTEQDGFVLTMLEGP